MARILLTAFIADIRNSVAGTTFSKGRYGNYVKSKGVPVKQNTSFQNAWRNTQSYISRSWKLLTESERTTWVTNAGNFPQIDKFGITFYLSGFSLYQQLNLNLAIIDGTPLVNCPGAEAVNPAEITLVSISWLAANARYYIWFEWTAGANPTREQQVFYCTQPGSPGQMAIGKTTYFVQSDTAESEETSVTDSFFEFFGAPAAGTKTFFSVKRINEFTGQAGVTDTQVIVFPPQIGEQLENPSGFNDGTATFYLTSYFVGGSAIVPVGYLIRYAYNYNFPGPVDPTIQSYTDTGIQSEPFTFTEEVEIPAPVPITIGQYACFRFQLLEALDSGTVVQTLYIIFQTT